MSNTDDFRVETYNDTEFTSTDVVGRDKAFEVRQKRAFDAGKSWVNDDRKYITKRNTNEQIRAIFTNIETCLKEFGKNDNSHSIVNIAERHNVQAYITERLGLLWLQNEVFWDEFSRNKDRLSYKFGSRIFPTSDTKWAESFNDEARTDAPEVVENTKTKEQIRLEVEALRKATRDRISKQYDINDVGMKNFMDRSYVDEDLGGTFQPLAPAQYYDLVSQSSLESIFQLCYDQHLYGTMLELWCLMISNKSFTHLVLNSTTILGFMFDSTRYSHETLDHGKVKLVVQNPFMDEKYREIVYHYLFYGIYILCREEYSVKIKAVDDLRYNMDLRCLAMIPPYEGPLNMNPFMPVTLNDKYLYATGIPSRNMIIRPFMSKMSDRGLYSLESFKKRFDVFTDDILVGIDFDKLYFTGSLIAACSMRNPLERKFGIDLPVNDDDIFGERAAKVYWNNVKKSLVNYFDEYYPSKNVLRIGSLSDDQLTEAESMLTDIDCIVDALEDSEFDRICIKLLKTIQSNLTSRFGREPTKREVGMVKIETSQSYKYHIYGTGVIRSIELFRIYELRPVGCVSRFHFAAVRGYYDGTTVRVLPSMWCTANTGICCDYKWFSNSKKPQTLICKYFLRGFYSLLNQQEQRNLRKFMNENAEWKNLDEIPRTTAESDDDDDSPDPADARARSISIMNPIFNPRSCPVGTYYKLREKFGTALIGGPATRYVQDANIRDLMEPRTVSSGYGFELTYRYAAGHIQSVNGWHLLPYVRDMNRSKKYNNFT